MEIIYEDKDIAVLNKPPGIAVHGGDRVRGETLVPLLLEKYPEIRTVGDEPDIRPGIVHRLDKGTSGVMVVARNQDTFISIKNIFKNRMAQKTYWAIVCGTPKSASGVINFPVGRLIRNPIKRGADTGRGGIRAPKDAETHYRVLKSGKDYSLLELTPKTGRMHQIRVHLKAINNPVACDRDYGGENVCCPLSPDELRGFGLDPFDRSRHMLHARSLSFAYPEGRKLFFEADPPRDFELAMEKIL